MGADFFLCFHRGNKKGFDTHAEHMALKEENDLQPFGSKQKQHWNKLKWIFSRMTQKHEVFVLPVLSDLISGQHQSSQENPLDHRAELPFSDM